MQRPSLWAFAAVLLALPARSEEVGIPSHFAGYAAGLHIFDLDLTTSLRPEAYRLRISFRLVGVVGALFHAEGTTTVDGRFEGSTRAVPRQAFSTGRFGGTQHVLQIDWRDGNPKLTQMTPPVEPDREPVAERDQAKTVDTLSAIAALLNQATQTGRCDAATRTFDGVRLSEFESKTVGPEMVEPSGRSSFQGQALRCDITGRMIGGFMRDADKEALRKPKHASAWLARLKPGQPMTPVRIAVYPEGSPTVTLYISERTEAAD